MWIVPKTLSHFVPVSGGLNLESTELAWIFSQSVTWRTKHFAKQTWLKRWKRERWIQHLFGRTLKPSTHNHFVESWTEYCVATHASHFPQREKGKAKKTQDTCGPTSANTSEQLILAGFLPKMSKGIYRLDSPQSSATWKKMVIKRRGEYSVRRKLARLTNGNESISLQNFPTPIVGEEKFRIKGNSHASICLSAMARRGELNWPTARTSDAEGGQIKTEMTEKGFRSKRKKSNQYFGAKLRDAVETYENWPTPRTGGGSRPNQKGGKVLNEEVQIEEGLRERGKKLIGPQDPDKNNTTGKNQESYRLNPNFVEQLMGLIVGWTQLSTEWIDSDCLAMG
jgi:hypothetical protein